MAENRQRELITRKRYYTPQALAADPGLWLEAAINLGCLGGALYSSWRFARMR